MMLAGNIVRMLKMRMGGGKFAIANLGSNPAMCGFEYESAEGINMSIGRSGLDMDLEVLKDYCYLLKQNATILIPIMPFYSILGDAKDTMLPQDRYAFYKILAQQRRDKMEMFEDLNHGLFFSLRIRLKNVWRFFRGKARTRPRIFKYRPITNTEFEVDAEKRCASWKKEFDISDFNAPLTPLNSARREKSVKHMHTLLDFCKGHNYKPVIILMPMTKHLLSRMSGKFRETYVYSFVKPIAKATNTSILDYMCDERFVGDELYCDSLFLNRLGARLFTQQVLKDIK